jgi:hypothetical protein
MAAKVKSRSQHSDAPIQGVVSVQSARATEDLQWAKYPHEKSGHGFAAEDANALNEELRFKDVKKTGTDNTKNGADRITNGVAIQTKYYSSASKSVNAAFDSSDGFFKYKGQLLEVPCDQYEDAVSAMGEKIKAGKVPGVSDPKKATEIVKKGSVTYKQARNIARAGNIDSVWFDIKTQAVTSSCAFGISFAVNYFIGIQQGLKPKQALRASIGVALKSGGIAMVSGVLTQQFLRTAAGRAIASSATTWSRHVINGIYKTKAGKVAVEKLASAIFKKALHGAAAKNAVSKLLRTNAVTAAVVTAVLAVPDFYRAFVKQSISWKQFTKNLTVSMAGVGGGAAGAVAGASIGSMVFPGLGTIVGGIIGGLAGGAGSAMAAKKCADFLVRDDAEAMIELLNEAVAELCSDHLITEHEFEGKICPAINKTVSPKWLRDMFQNGSGKQDPGEVRKMHAYGQLEPVFFKVSSERESIVLPPPRLIRYELLKVKVRLIFSYWLSILKTKLFRSSREALLVEAEPA